jgi:hypothetical protein
MAGGRPTRRQTINNDEARAKIRTTCLVNRLTDHVLGDVKMEQSQVSAALGLLKKSLPDLSAAQVQHSAGDDLLALLGAFDRTKGK